MKKTLLIFSLLFVSSICFSQEKCGTMQVLEQMKLEDPTLEKRIEENNKQSNDWIKENMPIRENKESPLPLIPGYIPTGDYKTDLANFQIAKQLLSEDNPEEYIQATRIKNDNEEEIQNDRKKKLEKQNKPEKH